MKQNFKRALVCGLTALITLAATAVPAFAAPGTPGEYTTGTVPMTKRVRVPNGTDNPANTYDFSFTPHPTAGDPSEMSPDINNNDAIPANDNKLSITFAGNEALSGPDADGYMYVEMSIPDILANTKFPHADIYSYDINEIAGVSSVGGGTMSYSFASYTMDVYVQNDTSAPNNLAIKHVIFTRMADDKGNADGTKADVLFTNTFAKDAMLEINKTVTGNYADLTKSFNFEIQVFNAPGVTGNNPYTATYTKQDGTTSTITINASALGGSNPFTLKHGEKLEINGLPVGSTYKLLEQPEPNYKASVDVKLNGVVTASEIAPAVGTPIQIGYSSTTNPLLQNAINVADGHNVAAWTNDYPNPTAPTGIIIDNLPFILLILVAVGGFIGFIALKRSRASR